MVEILALLDDHHPAEPHEYLFFLGVGSLRPRPGHRLRADDARARTRGPSRCPRLPRRDQPTQPRTVRAARLPRLRADQCRGWPAPVANVARPRMTPRKD
jgi:hypothetical protein